MQDLSSTQLQPDAGPVQRLALNSREASQALGISTWTLYRIEKQGLIKAVPGVRHKLYAVSELKKFVEGKRR